MPIPGFDKIYYPYIIMRNQKYISIMNLVSGEIQIIAKFVSDSKTY